MAKRIIFTIIGLLIVLGIIGGIKGYQIYTEIQMYQHYKMPAVAVSAEKARSETWYPFLSSVGTLQSVQGIKITPQVAGIVTEIDFKSGQMVQKGDVLLRLDSNVLKAQLKGAQAQLALAKINFDRQESLFQRKATSKADYDSARATMQQDQAQVDQYQALLNQKTIYAPFSGHLGIRQVSIGQYLKPGTTITNLQSTGEIYINYELPENEISKVHIGQTVSITTGAYAGAQFTGKISAIDAQVGSDTKSIRIQATIANDKPHAKLYSGMFTTVHTDLPTQEKVIVVPQQAVKYTLYGNSVYLITTNKDKQKIATQQTITTGPMHGNDVQVVKGLSAGDLVVTAGQIKLHNGDVVKISK